MWFVPGQPEQNRILKALLIIAFTLVAFSPSLSSTFLADDDIKIIEESTRDGGLSRVWLTSSADNYWPITYTVFWLEDAVWGSNQLGYRALNVFFHIGSALLIWQILNILKIPGSWLTALVFSVHPINVESVINIGQLKTVMSMFLYLLSIAWFLKFDADNKPKWYFGSLLMFLLAMLSKGGVVSLPLVLLLCSWWQRDTIGRIDIIRVLPYFFVALFMGVVEIWFMSTNSMSDQVPYEGFLARLTGVGWIIGFYLGKAFMPVNLSFVYPRWEVDLEMLLSYLPNLAIMALLATSYFFRKSWGKPVLMSLLYFILTLGPVLGLVNISHFAFTFVADHYAYVSVVSFFALVVGLCQLSFLPKHATAIKALTCVSILLLSFLSARRCMAYESDHTIWQDTVRKNPTSAHCYNMLGCSLGPLNRLDKAASHFEKAIKLDPEVSMYWRNLGLCYWDLQQTKIAANAFERGLKLEPDSPMLNTWFGLALYQEKQTKRALQHLQKAIDIDPQFALAHKFLSVIYNDLGESQRADYHRKLAKEEGLDVSPHFNQP